MSWKYLIPVLFLFSCGGKTTDDTNSGETESGHEEPEMLTPVDFNNEISFMQEGILAQIDVLFKSDSTNIDVNFENTKFEIELNIESLNAMKIPEGGEGLKNAMLDFLKFYQTELDGGFQRIIELLKKPEWTDAEQAEVESYDIQFAEGESVAFEKVIAEQEIFAKANRIQLQEL